MPVGDVSSEYVAAPFVIRAFLSQIEAVRKTLLESSTWRCVEYALMGSDCVLCVSISGGRV